MATKHGIVAVFNDVPSLFKAAEKVRDAGFTRWDVFTPFPVHGMNEAMGLPRSKVPRFTLFGGVLGFTLGMLLPWYTGELDYPLVVADMPLFSPIFPFPVVYELTILLASFGTLGGMFITNKLPQHYHPVMNFSNWERTTDDQLLVLIELADPKYHPEKTQALLRDAGATYIEEIEE